MAVRRDAQTEGKQDKFRETNHRESVKYVLDLPDQNFILILTLFHSAFSFYDYFSSLTCEQKLEAFDVICRHDVNFQRFCN